MTVFQPMQVKDVSRRCLTIETLFPLQFESAHDVGLALGDSSVVIRGRVVHSRISNVNQDVVAYYSGWTQPRRPPAMCSTRHLALRCSR